MGNREAVRSRPRGTEGGSLRIGRVSGQEGTIREQEENRHLIEGFWVDLYRQDFAALGARFDENGEYTDIVTPADDVARGPAQITADCGLPSINCPSC